jgi:phage-related baseplate assembly protein
VVTTVWPFSPALRYVTVLVLLEGGAIPDADFLAGLYDFLSEKDRRPLSDCLMVAAPLEVDYEIDVTYYIYQDFASTAQRVIKEAERAVDDYIKWQRQIRLDITPGELTHRLHSVPGIKRAEIRSPARDIVIDDRSISRMTAKTVSFGGLEEE